MRVYWNRNGTEMERNGRRKGMEPYWNGKGTVLERSSVS